MKNNCQKTIKEARTKFEVHVYFIKHVIRSSKYKSSLSPSNASDYIIINKLGHQDKTKKTKDRKMTL